jgi:hypothetical protein
MDTSIMEQVGVSLASDHADVIGLNTTTTSTTGAASHTDNQISHKGTDWMRRLVGDRTGNEVLIHAVWRGSIHYNIVQ